MLLASIDERAAALVDKVVAWRRDLHANPELANREFRTSQIVADHLRALGLEVATQIAHTGVVGVLRGTRAIPAGARTPVVALRADMDALPVAEQVDLPFASKVTTTFDGRECGVMHACGHDCHTAVLMGIAELFAGMRDQLPGTVKFIFQPSEEGSPAGERGGAELMVEEGVLDHEPRPDAIFGLHVTSMLNIGVVAYRPGAMMASSDDLAITIRGRQTHAAMPWLGADPVVAAAQVIVGLQSIVSRQLDTISEPAVVSIATIHGGVRSNIIPDRVEMTGTVRAFDEAARADVHRRIAAAAEHHASGCGCKAEVRVTGKYPVTINDPALSEWAALRLRRLAGDDHTIITPKVTGSEDFSYYQQKIPGFFYFVGITPPDQKALAAPPNHSPRFYVDEAGLPLAFRSLAGLAASFLAQPDAPSRLAILSRSSAR